MPFVIGRDGARRQMAPSSSSSSSSASRLARASWRVEYTAASKALDARAGREDDASRDDDADADAACVLRLDVVDDGGRRRSTVACEVDLEGAKKLDAALREASARVEALARASGGDARA
jgi:hypothetical protein